MSMVSVFEELESVGLKYVVFSFSELEPVEPTKLVVVVVFFILGAGTGRTNEVGGGGVSIKLITGTDRFGG